MKKTVSAVAGVALLGLLLSGCSGTAAPEQASEKPAASDLASQMLEEVEPLMERPTDIGIEEPVSEVPEGKEIVYMQCTPPTCEALGNALDEAAAEVGWTVRRIPTGATPEDIKKAWAQAVQLEPDAVIGVTHDRTYFEDEIQQLAEKDIPIVRLNLTDEAGDGVTANILDRDYYENAGKIMAQYAMSEHGEDLNALAVTVGATIPSLQVMAESFTATVEEACEACTVTTLELPSTSIGKDLPQRVAAELRSKPDINFIESGLSDMVLGVPPALRSAGIEPDAVELIALGALNPAANQALQEGDYLTAILTSASGESMWRAVDLLIREFNGEDISATADAETYPKWLVTADTLPSPEGFPTVEDYQDQFRALWGLD